MFGVKKGWKSWYALAVVFLTLGLSVPAGAISTDHSHGGHDSGNAAVDRPSWLKKLDQQLQHEDVMQGLEGSQEKLDQTFKGDDMLTDVDFRRRQVQYLYQDADGYTFMDVADYSQFTLGAEQLENVTPFLIDNAEGYTALIVEEVCVGVEPPGTVELTVTQTAPAIKGASQSARSKTAVLESGLEIQVPEYLAEGEVVKVNTLTREFISRA